VFYVLHADLTLYSPFRIHELRLAPEFIACVVILGFYVLLVLLANFLFRFRAVN